MSASRATGNTHHCIDSIFQFENLALGIDANLLAQVALCDGLCDLGDSADLRGVSMQRTSETTDLAGEIGGKTVDDRGELAPGAADVADNGLAAQTALGADLERDAGDLDMLDQPGPYMAHLLGKAAELVDHGVDDVLELDHDGALDGDGDLLAQIALGDGLADAGDVLDLGLEQLELLDGRHAYI